MNDKKVALKGGMWTSLSTAVTMLSQFGRVMILTRFLEKSDFGIVSMMTTIIGLCTAFADLGFASVIMYKQKLEDREFSSLFWTQLIIYTVLYAVLSLCSPLVASFYEEESLSYLIPLASLSLIFLALGKLYDSVLQKQYRFRLIAYRNITTNLLSIALAILLAWQGFGIYSLVCSTLFQALMYNLWNLISGFKLQRISLMFDCNCAKPLVKMGLYQTYTRIADYLSSRLDVLIIGKLLGAEALGVYDLAKELVFKLVSFVRSVVSQVALPIISNNNTDDDAVRARFLAITKVVAFMCLPICFTIAVFSDVAVFIVYGESYIPTAPLVSIFAIVTMLTSLSSFFDMLGIAKGRTDLNFKNTVYRIILTTPVVFVTSYISINAVALGQLVVTVILCAVFWKIVVKNTYPLKFSTYLSNFKRLLCILTITSLSMYIIKSLCLSNVGLMLNAFLIIIFIAENLVLGYIFLKEDTNWFIHLLRKK